MDWSEPYSYGLVQTIQFKLTINSFNFNGPTEQEFITIMYKQIPSYGLKKKNCI